MRASSTATAGGGADPGRAALRAAFDAENIRREVGVVEEEIQGYEDNPEELIHDLAAEELFRKGIRWARRFWDGGRPSRHLTAATVRRFHRDRYTAPERGRRGRRAPRLRPPGRGGRPDRSACRARAGTEAPLPGSAASAPGDAARGEISAGLALPAPPRPVLPGPRTATRSTS